MEMVTSDQFKARCEGVLARIRTACASAGRDPASVRLLPVTKTHPVEAALLAYGFGLRAVGENRVQEAAQKRLLAPSDLRWELIGHLQSNKAKQALQAFDVLQSVDSPELAVRLGRLAGEMGLRREVLLQVNSGDDPAKFGCDLAEAPRLLEAALAQPALVVKGRWPSPRCPTTRRSPTGPSPNSGFVATDWRIASGSRCRNYPWG
jgi:uncharacterized pyridoxal phosphate-containing UPF0001 family protein